MLAVAACLVIYLMINLSAKTIHWEDAARFGYLPSELIWDGQYWALITSAFVHSEIWHLFFNVLWILSLGSCMERLVGSVPFLGFLLASAFVSSAVQMIVSDECGIGASGMVYALFGFAWVAKSRYLEFQSVVTDRVALVFGLWFFGCMMLTHLKLLSIANGAHAGGLVFGILVAWVFVVRRQRILAISGLVMFLGACVFLLLWCPWSIRWVSMRAYQAHENGDAAEALRRYTQLIDLKPGRELVVWALENRSAIYQSMGDATKSKADADAAAWVQQGYSGE